MCIYIYTHFLNIEICWRQIFIYTRSHTKFGPDRLSRFDVYWIQTNKQTPRQTDRQYIYIDIDEYKDNNVKNAKLLKKRELFVLRLMWKFKFLSFGKYFQIEYVKLKYGEMTYILSKNVNVLAYKTFLTIEN